MQEKIKSIVRAFPDYEEKIEFLFMNDASFRELCTDYIFCASKILDMKKELGNYGAQIEEYEDLQWQLEQEILNLVITNRNSPEKI
jgi:hypothetical protein